MSCNEDFNKYNVLLNILHLICYYFISTIYHDRIHEYHKNTYDINIHVDLVKFEDKTGCFACYIVASERNLFHYKRKYDFGHRCANYKWNSESRDLIGLRNR